ncbi:Leptomycin B resistance protein pmd1 [Fusarium oxysporum f. sp. albedinis]|nr:Leptomycin B resistance protein pmd1 [Fusarium oxysporum f. sp. albedinis]
MRLDKETCLKSVISDKLCQRCNDGQSIASPMTPCVWGSQIRDFSKAEAKGTRDNDASPACDFPGKSMASSTGIPHIYQFAFCDMCAWSFQHLSGHEKTKLDQLRMLTNGGGRASIFEALGYLSPNAAILLCRRL